MPKLDLTSFLGEPANEPDNSTPSLSRQPTLVSNQFPTIQNVPYRIALIGEAPGRDEELLGKPFVGQSGRLLNQLLSKVGIIREACFVGNICQIRPPENDITKFKRDGPEITAGFAQLKDDLCQFNPNICILLGKTALWAFKGIDNIGDYRGSLFISNINALGLKCIASYHPAACLRQYDWTFPLSKDLQKGLREATTKDLILSQRELRVNLTVQELLFEMDKIRQDKPTISIDIEGWVHSLTCCSIAPSPTYSFIVPFTKLDGSNYYETLEDELAVWSSFCDIMRDTSIPKILQNSLYDRFVLQYASQCFVGGTRHDTMLSHWELYCELEKSLGFQGSLYTKEPYYKGDRKSSDRATFFRYCCMDSALTYECSLAQDKQLKAKQKAHYNFNVALLNPILYMELRGILYDTQKAKERLQEVNSHIYILQAELDEISNSGFRRSDLGKEARNEACKRVSELLCYKRDPTQPKKGNEEAFEWCRSLLMGEREITTSDIGRLNIECGVSMNIKSIDFKTYLYETLQLPKQYSTDPNTGLKRLSANYESLLKLSKKTDHRAITLALELGMLRTRSQMLEIHADKDGRIRCGYNIVGTETGRITCYTSPTGSGYNLQTIPADNFLQAEGHPLRKGMRDLFIADPGYYLFQCDLKGADGWTVGAHMAALGDRTMLDDLLFGLKPAAIVCYLLRHGASSLHNKSRLEIKELLKEVKKDDWDYYASKVGIWMTCYMGGPRKLADTILINSEGKVAMSESEVRTFQAAVFARYRVKLWHDATARKLAVRAEITSASGHTRRFYGRPNEILGEALADEPQEVTTYAINLTAYKLWTDPENRLLDSPSDSSRSSSVTRSSQFKLRVEPLHQVHDALIGQFKITDTTWAVNKIKSWFANEIIIAGIPITIPFDGQYGTSWGDLNAGTI